MRESGLWQRFSAASGMLYVLLNIFTLFVLIIPPPGAPTKEIAAFYLAHAQTFLIVNYITLLELLVFLWFSSYLCALLLRATGGTNVLTLLVFAAALVYVMVLLVGLGISQTIPLRVMENNDLTVLRALSDIQGTLGTAGFIPGALLVGTASVLLLQTAVVPRWISIVGMVVAGVQGLASLSLIFTSGPLAAAGVADYIAYLGFLFWLVAVSLILAVRVGSAQRVAHPLPSM